MSKKDVFSVSSYRVEKIKETVAKHGRCEVICSAPDEFKELNHFVLENHEGSLLPGGNEFSSSRLFVVTGVL